MRELFRRCAGLVHPKQITDARRRRNQKRELCTIGRRAKTLHGLVAGGDVSLFARGRVESSEVCAAFFPNHRDNRFAVGRPGRRKSAAAAGGAVVAANSPSPPPKDGFLCTNPPVVSARQKRRLSSRRD